MKPERSHDFRVKVCPFASDEGPDQSAYHEDMYVVILNNLLQVAFIPAFSWDPWPPTMPEDIDVATSVAEARRVNAALALYLVTPDTERAGEERPYLGFVLDDGEPRRSTAFYVRPDEFEVMLEELQRLGADDRSANLGVPVSQLGGSRLATLLSSRIATSPSLDPGDRRWLGRGPDEPRKG